MNLKELQNKHKGQMAFVAGAGPSLRLVDPKLLKDYVVFTANSAILKFPDCDYFVTDDEGVCTWNYWIHTVKNSRCTKLLYEKKLKDRVDHLRPEEVVLFDHRQWATPNNRGELVYHKENLKLTEDAEFPIIGSRSSQATALHWAYIMGCDPIVLLGHDCCYEGRNRYFWQFPGETRAIQYQGFVESNPNRGFIKDKPVDKHCVAYDLYWQHFAEVNPDAAKGRIIYVSPNGILDVFPKRTLEEVLEQYKERTKYEKQE